MMKHVICAAIFCAATASIAMGQWDPANGQWGKTAATDFRVMTWNILDGVCRTNDKLEGNNNWTALARIVAAMKPDVLILQETGDNTGNGTGSGVDSVSQLEQTFDLFLHGGNDQFNGNTPVTSWVQKYAPAFDMPHVFVSSQSDSFNRNVILSRFPFSDLNGDNKSLLSDIFALAADEYAPGGNGGIRGFMFAEINLPEADYAGDIVVGNAHLKAGGSGGDLAQRLTASQNVAYFIDYFYNGAGTGTVDPNSKIIDIPAATSILDSDTPIIIGGDWNEDEGSNGRKGPAEWLTRAEFTGGSDGTDRDLTDSTFDAAAEPFSGSQDTRFSSKLDYIAWQDSIATERRSFIFDAAEAGAGPAMPPEVAGMQFGGIFANTVASDHLPVISDFILPGGLGFPDCNNNGVDDADDIAMGTDPDCDGNGIPDSCDIAAGTFPDCNGNGVPDLCDISSGTSPDTNGNGVPDECDPPPPCPWDFNDDNFVSSPDLAQVLGSWGPNPGAVADFDGDDNVGSSDMAILLGAWGPCPS